jgi:hypothetical protein
MPVTYVIDKPRKFIHTRCLGDTTLEEVIGHFDELVQDPDCPDQLDVLLDLSEMNSVPESDQLWTVSKKIGNTVSRVRFDRCAIVAVEDVIFGMSRVFAAFAENHFEAVQVFRDQKEAQNWLAKKNGDI